jgi:hypothetical protein
MRLVISRLGSSLRHLERSELIVTGLLTATLFAGLLFGGSATGRPAGFLTLPLLAAATLVVAVWRLVGQDAARMRLPLILCLGLVALPLLQLIPLPYNVWTSMGGRELARETLTALSAGEPSRPLSLTPSKTIDALAWLLVPIAVFLGVATLGGGARRWLVGVFLVLSVVGLALAISQMQAGPSESLLPYEHVNKGLATGFFANRNHQAASLALAIVLVGGINARALQSRSSSRASGARYVQIGLIGVLFAGALATLSRAGLVLSGLAVVISLMLLFGLPRDGQRLGARAGWILAIAAVVAAAAFLGLGPVLDRFDRQGPEGRYEYWPSIARSAVEAFPWGTGLGSFDAIMRSVEPLHLLAPNHMNEAHNDYLQLLLEAGAAFPVLLIAFVGWLAIDVRPRFAAAAIGEQRLALAALAGLGLLALHSLADYPIRTPAMAIVAAILLGLLVRPARSKI